MLLLAEYYERRWRLVRPCRDRWYEPRATTEIGLELQEKRHADMVSENESLDQADRFNDTSVTQTLGPSAVGKSRPAPVLSGVRPSGWRRGVAWGGCAVVGQGACDFGGTGAAPGGGAIICLI